MPVKAAYRQMKVNLFFDLTFFDLESRSFDECAAVILTQVLTDNGHSPSHTKRFLRNSQHRGRLMSFKFIDIDKSPKFDLLILCQSP